VIYPVDRVIHPLDNLHTENLSLQTRIGTPRLEPRGTENGKQMIKYLYNEDKIDQSIVQLDFYFILLLIKT